jgi:hypothetical protein
VARHRPEFNSLARTQTRRKLRRLYLAGNAPFYVGCLAIRSSMFDIRLESVQESVQASNPEVDPGSRMSRGHHFGRVSESGLPGPATGGRYAARRR